MDFYLFCITTLLFVIAMRGVDPDKDWLGRDKYGLDG
jgi:hypothetical protein